MKEGAIAAFEAGVLDVAFAPSNCCRGKVLPMRDHEGYIRLFSRGPSRWTPSWWPIIATGSTSGAGPKAATSRSKW